MLLENTFFILAKNDKYDESNPNSGRRKQGKKCIRQSRVVKSIMSFKHSTWVL